MPVLLALAVLSQSQCRGKLACPDVASVIVVVVAATLSVVVALAVLSAPTQHRPCFQL